jgi:hypothetical protein
MRRARVLLFFKPFLSEILNFSPSKPHVVQILSRTPSAKVVDQRPE